MRKVLSGDVSCLPHIVNRNVVTIPCEEVQQEGSREHPDVLEDKR